MRQTTGVLPWSDRLQMQGTRSDVHVILPNGDDEIIEDVYVLVDSARTLILSKEGSVPARVFLSDQYEWFTTKL